MSEYAIGQNVYLHKTISSSGRPCDEDVYLYVTSCGKGRFYAQPAGGFVKYMINRKGECFYSGGSRCGKVYETFDLLQYARDRKELWSELVGFVLDSHREPPVHLKLCDLEEIIRRIDQPSPSRSEEK